MYAVKLRTEVKTDLARILAVAKQYTPTFYFENQKTGVLRIGLGAVEKIETISERRTYQAVWGWYHQMMAKIPSDCDVAVMGGFPFESADPALHSEAVSQFFLPQFSIVGVGDGRFNISAVGDEEDETDAMLTDFIDQLANQTPLTGEKSDAVVAEQLGVDAYIKAVKSAILRMKVDDNLDKVVLTRRVTATAQSAFDPELVWLNARGDDPESYVIMLRTDKQTFISNTPEQLMRLAHRELTTAAVAGTTARGASEQTDEPLRNALLGDAKNRQEHSYVVLAIAEVLAEAGVNAVYPVVPQVMVTQNLQHLYTPFKAQVNDDVDVFLLVASLHPTPALGGMPQGPALRLIHQVEDFDRGLFGAPIGFVSATGEAEFAVGIRSAVLDGRHATLYAGSGIVEESLPGAEVDETRLKFDPMLHTLFKKEPPLDAPK